MEPNGDGKQIGRTKRENDENGVMVGGGDEASYFAAYATPSDAENPPNT